jgi:anti-sigma-K factor RskA
MTEAALPPSEEDLVLTGEYVTGLLSLAERAAAGARLRRDPAFGALVSDWENRLADLNDGYAEAPAPNLLPAIEARLFPVTAKPRRNWLGWLGGAAAAASLAVAVLVMLPQVTPAPVIATLANTDAPLRYEAAYADGALIVTRVAGTPAPAGQVHELWIIAPDSAPVSLGLLADASLTITAPRPPAGWVLAISLEPAGGSTTGAPTGPVLLTGEIGL